MVSVQNLDIPLMNNQPNLLSFNQTHLKLLIKPKQYSIEKKAATKASQFHIFRCALDKKNTFPYSYMASATVSAACLRDVFQFPIGSDDGLWWMGVSSVGKLAPAENSARCIVAFPNMIDRAASFPTFEASAILCRRLLFIYEMQTEMCFGFSFWSVLVFFFVKRSIVDMWCLFIECLIQVYINMFMTSVKFLLFFKVFILRL